MDATTSTSPDIASEDGSLSCDEYTSAQRRKSVAEYVEHVEKKCAAGPTAIPFPLNQTKANAISPPNDFTDQGPFFRSKSKSNRSSRSSSPVAAKQPILDHATRALNRVEESVESIWHSKALSAHSYALLVSGFASFLAKRNLIDTGLGLVIGSAFSSMVQHLVDDLVAPFIGLIVGSRMSNWFFVLRFGEQALALHRKSGTRLSRLRFYNTLDQAIQDGAVTLNIGRSLESIMRFACISMAVFAAFQIASKIWAANRKTLQPVLFPNSMQQEHATADNAFRSDANTQTTKEVKADTKKCTYCLSDIPSKAFKCRYCCSAVIAP